MNTMLSEIGTLDVWTELHTQNGNYTYYSAPDITCSRIDYF